MAINLSLYPDQSLKLAYKILAACTLKVKEIQLV